MFTLWLSGAELAFGPEQCRGILTLLDQAKGLPVFCHVGGLKPKHKAGYAKPFFRFTYNGKHWQVPRKRYAELEAALRAGAEGETARYAQGWQPISSVAIPSLDEDGLPTDEQIEQWCAEVDVERDSELRRMWEAL
jgi:hypothetical protein